MAAYALVASCCNPAIFFSFLFFGGRKLTCPSLPSMSAIRRTDKANQVPCCVLSGCFHHNAFILIHERLIHVAKRSHAHIHVFHTQQTHWTPLCKTFTLTSQCEIHTLRCYKAHMFTASRMSAGWVLEQGFLHTQRRLLSFLFATNAEFMQPDAAPRQFYLILLTTSYLILDFTDNS